MIGKKVSVKIVYVAIGDRWGIIQDSFHLITAFLKLSTISELFLADRSNRIEPSLNPHPPHPWYDFVEEV